MCDGWCCRTDAGQADEGAELVKELRQGLHAGDPGQPSVELLVEFHELLTGTLDAASRRCLINDNCSSSRSSGSHQLDTPVVRRRPPTRPGWWRSPHDARCRQLDAPGPGDEAPRPPVRLWSGDPTPPGPGFATPREPQRGATSSKRGAGREPASHDVAANRPDTPTLPWSPPPSILSRLRRSHPALLPDRACPSDPRWSGREDLRLVGESLELHGVPDGSRKNIVHCSPGSPTKRR